MVLRAGFRVRDFQVDGLWGYDYVNFILPIDFQDLIDFGVMSMLTLSFR